MTTLSVPVNTKQEKFIASLVESGKAANMAHAVRQAVDFYLEEKLVADVLESEMEMREGKILYGDPRKLIKKF